jgi:hypothetical protein
MGPTTTRAMMPRMTMCSRLGPGTMAAAQFAQF